MIIIFLFIFSFEINFKTGPSDGDDIAFHFNPRIDQYVYLNSFRNGSWEKREPTPNIPFNKGTTLNMFVVIKLEGYEVCCHFDLQKAVVDKRAI